MNLHEFYLAMQIANQKSNCCAAISELQLNGTDICVTGKTVLIEEEESE